MKNSESGTDNPWEKADGDEYSYNIGRKIPGYQLQYDLMDTLLTPMLERQGIPGLLVVGAGGGQELVTLGRIHPDWSFCGLDTSSRMLLSAQQRIAAAGLTDRVQLHHADIRSWNSARQYDAATCMLVLHFVQGRENKLALLQAIAGYLKPGAPLFISAINGDTASHEWALQMAGWKLHMLNSGIELSQWEQFAGSFGVTSHPLPADEMEKLLREAGFGLVSRYFGSYLIDGLVAVKQPDRIS